MQHIHLVPWLMTPYPENEHTTPAQLTFNNHLSRAWVTMVQAFGRLKERWQCLMKRCDCTINNINTVNSASCMLHNFCEENSEGCDCMDVQEDNNEVKECDDFLGQQLHKPLEMHCVHILQAYSAS